MPNQQDYYRLFEDSPTPMYIYDSSDYHFLTVNESALAQFGYTRDEFMQLNGMAIRPAEDVEKFCEINKQLPDNYNDTGRWRHQNKNGDVFCVQIYTRRTLFAGANAVLVLAINIDNKVKTEHALEEKIRETERIMDSITDCFYAINRDWDFTYVNKECEKVFQQRRSELIGKNSLSLFPQAKELKFYDEYSRAMRDGVSVHFEEYDPVYSTWVCVNAYPSEKGLAVYFTDITEKKKIAEQIFRDQQNLRAIINNTKDFIWSMDTNYKIISANNAFWERIAYIAGKQTFEVVASDYEPALFATWRQYFERAMRGESYKITWESEYNGAIIYEDVSFNPIYDRDGSVCGISCFSRDITAEKKYEQKIERQNAQLREIAWKQSHQARRYVANILGLMQLVDVDNMVDDECKSHMKILQTEAETLDQVIKEITDCTLKLE